MHAGGLDLDLEILQFHHATFRKTFFKLAQTFSYLLLICFAKLSTAAAIMSHWLWEQRPPLWDPCLLACPLSSTPRSSHVTFSKCESH